MKSLITVVSFCGLLALGACSSKVTPSGGSTSASGKHTEDLSVYRPVIQESKDTTREVTSGQPKDKKTQYVEPRFAVNERLDAVLDSIDRINLNGKYVDGFTIQVYSGTKREEALNVKRDLSLKVPEIESELQYMQPNFRVRVGKYFTRLEAQKDYLLIRKYFPNTIVIPDRIPIPAP